MNQERIAELAADLRSEGDEFDGPSVELMKVALTKAVNEALEDAAKRFEDGHTALKADSAALAAGTLRGMKVA